MKIFLCFAMLAVFSACSSHQDPSPSSASASVEEKKNVAYGGHCGMGLCYKKMVKGDPKYAIDYKDKTYYFSSAEARDKFMANIDENIQKANRHWETNSVEKVR